MIASSTDSEIDNQEQRGVAAGVSAFEASTAAQKRQAG